MNFLKSMAVAATVFFTFAAPTTAATFDVDTGTNYAAYLILSESQDVGQTFLSGLSGALERVEMHLYAMAGLTGGTVTANVHAGLNGALLGTSSIAATSIATGGGGIIAFDFTNVNVMAGQSYWVNLMTDLAATGGGINPLAVGAANSFSDSYANGTGTVGTNAFFLDHTLRTYVDTAAVPLPAGLPLLGLAIGGLGLLRHRNRAKA